MEQRLLLPRDEVGGRGRGCRGLGQVFAELPQDDRLGHGRGIDTQAADLIEQGTEDGVHVDVDEIDLAQPKREKTAVERSWASAGSG